MSRSKDVVIKTRIEDLGIVEEAVEEMAEEMGWSMKFTNQVQLVLEELIVNIIHYGHYIPDDPNYEVYISMNADTERLLLEIKDDGTPFDPLVDGPPVDTKSDIAHRKVGGLGIHLVRKLTNEISYRWEDGMNKLTIIKYVESDAGETSGGS